MAIMLLPEEIPRFWEAIKYAAVNADFVEDRYREKYLNNLLYMLLSGKAQCFVRLSNERMLEALALTSIEIDRIRDEKTLFVIALYSFKKTTSDVWKDDLEALVKLARSSKCSSVTFWTSNEKIVEIFKDAGFNKRLEMYMMEVR